MMTVEKIFLSVEKGLPPKAVNQAELILDFGIAGDRFAGKDNRHICLLDIGVSDSISGLDGLCTKKFVGNFLTSGLDYKTVRIGQKYQVSDCIIEIVDVGKPCYPECPLVIAKNPCDLRKGCAFARIVKGGWVYAGCELLEWKD